MTARTISLLVAGAAILSAQVPFERILQADREPQNWLTYSGNLNGQCYSNLTQITVANAKNLELKWVLQTRTPAEAGSKYEATSVVVDGVLYNVQPPNVVVPVDAVTAESSGLIPGLPPWRRASGVAG